MKKIIKISSFVLLIFTMLFSLSSCSFKDRSEEAKSVAQNFLTTYQKYDVDKIKEYISDETKNDVIPYHGINAENAASSIIAAVNNSNNSSFSEDVMSNLSTAVKDMFIRANSLYEYEIIEVSKSEKCYIVKYESTFADYNKLNDSFSEKLQINLTFGYPKSANDIANIFIDTCNSIFFYPTVTEEKNLVIIEKDGKLLVDIEQSSPLNSTQDVERNF